jgi:hypothetical protein
MFLQDKKSGTLIEVVNLENLINPTKDAITGRVQDGQEEQDPAPVKKQDLVFPSGEDLPRCWIDENYRNM